MGERHVSRDSLLSKLAGTVPLLKTKCHAWWLNWDLDQIKLACSSKSYRRECRDLDSLGMVKPAACQFVAALLNPLAAPSLVSLHHSFKRLEAKPSTPVWTLSDDGRPTCTCPVGGKRASPRSMRVREFPDHKVELRQPWAPRLSSPPSTF